MIQTKQIGSKTKIYTDQMGGGATTYITESYPTNFHTFATSVILKTPADIEKYKEVTEAQRKAIEAADALWVEPPQVFVDLWNEACRNFGDYVGGVKTVGRYNPDTGYFELNGLTDITYEQAVAIYSKTSGLYYLNGSSIKNTQLCLAANIRTNLPIGYKTNWLKALDSVFHGCTEMEVLFLPGVQITGYMIMQKLHTLTIGGIADNICTNSLPLLKNIIYVGDNGSLPKRCDKSFAKSELLTRVSVANVVAKEPTGTQAVAFTMHPTVYAALMGEAENYPVNEGSREDWSEVFRQAQEKGITFASA